MGMISLAKKVTMQQIAEHLNLSKFAISKALSGKPGVSEDTRERIIQIATQLGYFSQKKYQLNREKQKVIRYQTAMRQIEKTKENQTILVLIPNIRFQTEDSYYWGSILDGISDELEQRGVGTMVVTEHNSDHFLKIINPQSVLGMIGVGMISNLLLLEVRKFGIPFVLIDHIDPLVPSDTLFMNNFECISRVTNYLIGLGHKRFQFVGNISYSRSFFDRWMGFRSILEEQNFVLHQNKELINLRYEEGEDIDEIRTILEKMKKDGTIPTALVCANDALAMGILTALDQLGIKVPEQCSVTGFDNIKDSMLVEPSLTTVNVAKEVLGKRAVETLLWRIDHLNEPLGKTLLHGELIIRSSVSKLL
jgi:LacI family transcriptional regulator